jgi:cytochrome P450
MSLVFDDSQDLWVARGPAVAQALAHPHLHVRPPAQPVPAALQGTVVGEVFGLLVRMTDGDFHARHKPAVRASAQRWSGQQVHAAATAAARSLWDQVGADDWLWQVPVQAVARLLGVPEPDLPRTVAAVRDFTRAIAPNADASAIAQAQAPVRDLMAQGQAQGLDRVQCANRIALMQQALDATSGLIGNVLVALQREGAAPDRALVERVALAEPAVVNTRRFAVQDLDLAGQGVRRGQCVLLQLGEAGLPFGAGAHECPGRQLALDIAAAAVAAVPFASRDWTPRGWRPLPNARIPVFTG